MKEFLNNMLSKTDHKSLEAAVATAYGDDTRHDCARIAFNTGDNGFKIEFLDPNDGQKTVYNVTGFDSEEDRKNLHHMVPLDVEEEGTQYMIFASEAESEPQVIEEIETIAGQFSGELTHVVETETFTACKPTLLDNLKSLLWWNR